MIIRPISTAPGNLLSPRGLKKVFFLNAKYGNNKFRENITVRFKTKRYVFFINSCHYTDLRGIFISFFIQKRNFPSFIRRESPVSFLIHLSPLWDNGIFKFIHEKEK